MASRITGCKMIEMMQCRYCGAGIEHDDHRCLKCGRRLYVAPTPSGPPLPHNRLSTAPVLQMQRRPKPEGLPKAPPPEPRQANLFSGDHEPLRVVPQAPIMRRSPPSKSPPHARRTGEDRQQPLMFPVTPRPNESAGGISVETRLYCNAPVAGAAHRLVACALDGSILMISFGLFLVVFHFSGGKIVQNAATLPFFGAAAAALLLLYRLLWCLANADSVGMRWTGLRLVTFDGVEPERSQRFHRLIASCVSAMPAGLGLIWALVDEEKLTWHDHITRTFPTPRRGRTKHPKR